MSQTFDPTALEKQKHFYDQRFTKGYMQSFDYDVFELTRVQTIEQVIGQLKRTGFDPKSILDYGCGEGRYLGKLAEWFPSAALAGCDISDVGLEIARSRTNADLRQMADERTAWPDASFDLVLSVEVLEHVADVSAATREIGRVLKPGGIAIITTPCANRFSLEWTIQKMTGGLQPSPDGFGRFASDEPGHLRRLNDRHMTSLLNDSGIDVTRIYHRAHFFATLIDKRFIRKLSQKFRASLCMLEWHLFKHLPNGATMLVLGRRR